MPASSTFTAPQWVNSLYSKFPLVTLEQDDVVEWRQTQTRKANYSLWVRCDSNAHLLAHVMNYTNLRFNRQPQTTIRIAETGHLQIPPASEHNFSFCCAVCQSPFAHGRIQQLLPKESYQHCIF